MTSFRRQLIGRFRRFLNNGDVYGHEGMGGKDSVVDGVHNVPVG